MLFNLTTRKLFKCNKHEWAITCCKLYGPVFGAGELAASNEPFNGNNNCRSNANCDVYKIEKDSKEIHMLTNLKCKGLFTSFFSISELEVWEVTFEK